MMARRILRVARRDALFVGTTGLLVSLVVAHLAPWSLSRLPLATLFWVWCAVAALALAREARAASDGRREGFGERPDVRDRTTAALLFLAIAGVSLAAGRNLILGLLRTFGGHADLTYNIDGRFLLMHAWSILRREGVTEALSMAGTPITYHSGPAWFAAASASLLDSGPEVWLFLWFPLAAVIAIALSGFQILRRLGAAPVSAVVGLALAASPLWEHVSLGDGRHVVGTFVRRGVGEGLEEAAGLILGSTQTDMLNALFGLAVILVAVAHFAERPSSGRLLISSAVVMLSSVTKPQYAIAGSILLFAVGIALHRENGLRLPAVLVVPLLGAVASVALQQLLLGRERAALGISRPERPFAVVVDWRSVDPFLPAEPQFVIMLLAAVLLLAWRGPLEPFERRAGTLLGSLVVALTAFWLLLHVLVASAGPSVRAEVLEWAWNSMQVRLPLLPFGIAVVGAVALRVVERRGVVARLAFAVVLLLGVVSSGHELVREWTDPPSGHEAVDAPYVRELLQDVNPSAAVIVVSDLSDPAQGHRRSGSAFYLSNAYGHQFWLAQTRYGHEFFPETEVRVAQLDRFFATEWSSWHAELLSTEGLTHVMISGRCPSAWDPDAVPMLTRTAATGGWDLYEVAPPSAVWTLNEPPGLESGPAPDQRAQAQVPLFGGASCR